MEIDPIDSSFLSLKGRPYIFFSSPLVKAFGFPIEDLGNDGKNNGEGAPLIAPESRSLKSKDYRKEKLQG